MDIYQLRLSAKKLLSEHNLVGWRFFVLDLNGELGLCLSTGVNKGLILIDKYYASNNDFDKVIETLKHEIAHAIVGPEHEHDKTWEECAVSLGVNPSIYRENAVVRPSPWQAVCGKCGLTLGRRRRPRSDGHYTCPCGETLTFQKNEK